MGVSVSVQIWTHVCPFQLYTFEASEGDLVMVSAIFTGPQWSGQVAITDRLSARYAAHVRDGQHTVEMRIPYSGSYLINVTSLIPANRSCVLTVLDYTNQASTEELANNLVWSGAVFNDVSRRAVFLFRFLPGSSLVIEPAFSTARWHVAVSLHGAPDGHCGTIIKRNFTGDMTVGLVGVDAFDSGAMYQVIITLESHLWGALRIKTLVPTFLVPHESAEGFSYFAESRPLSYLDLRSERNVSPLNVIVEPQPWYVILIDP
jgi:hypothetical protein